MSPGLARLVMRVCVYMKHKVVSSRAFIYLFVNRIGRFCMSACLAFATVALCPAGRFLHVDRRRSEILGSRQSGEALELTSRLSSTRAPRPGRRKSAKSGTCRLCHHLGYLQMLTRPGYYKAADVGSDTHTTCISPFPGVAVCFWCSY